GFVSGYRGSPLGGLDQELWRASEHLTRFDIRFQPGLNEDLAATAVWGSQQVNLFPGAKYDGVYAMWYGKGPGVDRSGDVFKHGNAGGTSPRGGVLAVAGDDHLASSSTLPCESDDAFISFGMPLLAPSSVQDILDLGLMGWELSRFSGLWVGFKTIAEIVEVTATVQVDLDRFHVATPEDIAMPLDGVHIREPDTQLAKEERLYHYKLPAAKAFSQANGINKVTLNTPNARLGVAAVGKSYADIREAVAMLDLDDERLAGLGMRFLKVNMPWPLDEETVRAFGRDLKEILVIEEKRPLVENQMRMALFSHVLHPEMIIVGKKDETGRPLLSDIGAFSTIDVAEALLGRLIRFNPDDQDLRDKLAKLKRSRIKPVSVSAGAQRTPYFCSGCPHNTSTRVPEGSRAGAGIGCHYMVQWMDRETSTFTQMGGEGASWIGQAPFTDEDHFFVNLGDGTYTHSGSLAIRAAVAAGVNITYKILYNDAVAMTGGQPAEGGMSVLDILRQVKAERVTDAVIVTDEPDKYDSVNAALGGTKVEHRRDLDDVQKRLRATPGVTVLIYDQMCATEKRRRRKRGKLAPAPERVFINELVCEGCGDCGAKSNCLSVTPVETEFGRKRRIDQSTCNADYSCVNGFCPSFVTVSGGQVRRPKAAEIDFAEISLPAPDLADPGRTYNIAVCGVGGTGVLTVGSVLAMAAHLERKTASVLDQTGLAQKGGAVVSHLRIAAEGRPVDASRIPDGRADLLLACDLLVAVDAKAAPLLNPERTRAVMNTHVAPNAALAFDPNAASPEEEAMTETGRLVRDDAQSAFDAHGLSLKAMGDAIFTNMVVVG
ncbi:MAG: indolepyruvate ferredoxin oxidoreductase family protein, partial [Pseudomonadota bacterium]